MEWEVTRKSKNNSRLAGPLTLGNYIRKLRVERGLTLRSLATTTGLSASSLCRLEKGAFVPVIQKDVQSLDRLWMALGGDMNQILYLSRRCPVCSGVGTIKEWTE